MKLKFCLLILLISVFSRVAAFVVYENTDIWDQQSITFYFLDGSLKQKKEVIEFAKLWQRYIGIKFKYTSTKPSIFNFEKYYKITFKGNSNESTRGAVNGTIHFGNLSENKIFRKTTVLHEFGHMLGLGHEHQRQDRPLTLNNYKIIDSCVKNQKQTRSWCKENLNDINHSEVFIESEYDPLSIMHYVLDNIVDKESPLLRILPVTRSNSLSFTDKYYIAMLYNQNISDGRLNRMHQQDIEAQKTFEIRANREREKAIDKLTTSSCKTLKHPNRSLDGKYCESGFMIIGKDNYSFPDKEFKTCYISYADIRDKMNQHGYCHLSRYQLAKKRQYWSQQFSSFGNCKILETGQKNNQDYFCQDGYSFVTKNNDMVGETTQCFTSKETVYKTMQEHKVCNMSQSDLRIYQRMTEIETKKRLKTSYCQVVTKKYRHINCPKDFDYTIINNNSVNEPIGKQCYSNKFQAINAMNKIPFCRS